jgi:hypothetical protein
MKRLTLLWLIGLFFYTSVLQAQSIPERDSSAVSVFEYATKIPKRNKVFNLDLEMHGSFNSFFNGGKFDEAAAAKAEDLNIVLCMKMKFLPLRY